MNLQFAHQWIALDEVLHDLTVDRTEWLSWVANGDAPDAVLWLDSDGLLSRDTYEQWCVSRTVEGDG
ncbi:hypothetical protein ACIBKY_35625 [Nonomuraea sp. NPDC050394]|uniref:hypothetical protein n=1 Tax=Nonomuraea sp. NPDC050394 TaxID=3364363 RepID=UPI00378FD96F